MRFITLLATIALLLTITTSLSTSHSAITHANAQVLQSNCSAALGTCVRIGVFRCDGTATQCPIIGYSTMIDWYIKRVQATGLNGLPVFFVQSDFVLKNVNTEVKTKFIGNATAGPFVDFVILPPGSSWASSSASSAMVLLEAAKIPSIASNSPASTLYQCGTTKAAYLLQPPCTAINSRRFQYAHGIASPGEQYFQSWVGLLKLKKAASIGVIQTPVSLYPTVYNGLLLAATDYGIPVTYTATAYLNGTSTLSPVYPSNMTNIITDLINIQPEGLVIAAQNCIPWIQAFKERNYAPSSLATLLCTDSTTALAALGTDLTYVVGTAQWSPYIGGNDYFENADTQPWSFFPHQVGGVTVGKPSPAQFTDLWRTLTNNTGDPGGAEASVLAAFEMLEGAINLAGTVNPAAVQAQLLLYYQSSYFGLISTNRYGANQQKQLVINQRDANNVLSIISPTSAANLDFIYPMPVWSDRIYTRVILGTTIEYLVIALLIACCLFTLSLCLYLFANRNQQVFQAAGLPFYLMMGLGCIVAFGSVLTWGVENNSATCSSRIWLWTICFHMFVDPLLASSWRISRIFSQKLQTVKLTNKMVGAVCLVLFAPQLIINIVWAIVAPLEPTVVTSDPLRPANTSFTTCSAGDAGVIFTGVTLGYSALMLVSACYLAFKVRKAYRMFNDAKPIAMSMYIFTVTAAIILVIQIALNTQTVSAQKVLFGLRSIGVLIAYQSSLSLLYFRRILGQVDVSKYKGNKSALESSEDTTTTDGIATPGGAVKKPGAVQMGENGQKAFQKGDGSNQASRADTSAPSSANPNKNVHVHIQPPAMYAGGASSTGMDTNSGGSPAFLPRPPPAGRGNIPIGGASPSRSAHVGSTVAVSALALDTLSATPKLTGVKRHSGSDRPKAMAIVQLPAAIPLPSHAELLSMDNSQLISLVQQFHAQVQVLRSQVRSQNLTNAALARGEAPPEAGRMGLSLPGTPDRSPRLPSNATTTYGAMPSPSIQEGTPLSGEQVALRNFGDSSSDTVMNTPPLPPFTRQNSELDQPGIRSQSADSTTSGDSPNHTNGISGDSSSGQPSIEGVSGANAV